MRRVTLTLLLLTTGVALAQNPFRDLMAAPQPEAEPTINTPITIDIPEAPLPAPPMNVDGYPALPAAGAYEGGTSSSPSAPVAPVVNIPDHPIVFALPDLRSSAQPETMQVVLTNPLHAARAAGVKPLLEPLPTPVTVEEEPAESPETAGEEASAWCVDGAVLATSGGQAPSALIRCGGVTHLLRVGDTIPGTDATIETIHTLGVTITREGAAQQLQLATN